MAGRGGSADSGAAGSASTSEAGANGASGAAGSDGAVFAPSCIPRQDCQNLCGTLGNDPAACGLGNVAQCGCICEERFDGPCPALLAALLACTGASPSIDCKQRGRIFEGCESESLALEVCDFRAREQLCAQDNPRCMSFCQSAVLSFCPGGPESLGSCLCGCEETFITSCATQFDAFMTCSADTPAFTCDANGRNQSTSCVAEWQALQSCQSASVPDAG
jgi:hypothetical protein